MIDILIVFLLGIVLPVCFLNISAIVCFGKMLSDKEIEAYLLDNPVHYRGSRILSFKNSFVGIIDHSDLISSKYYINDLGMVPKWSKYSKQIEEMFVTTIDFDSFIARIDE